MVFWKSQGKGAWNRVSIKTTDEVEKLAENAFYFCCAARSKDGRNPFEVCGNFEDLFDESKEFYRNIARWHLNHKGKGNGD